MTGYRRSARGPQAGARRRRPKGEYEYQCGSGHAAANSASMAVHFA